MLTVNSISSGHPCHSSVGKSSDICKQIFNHCSTSQGKESKLCKSLNKVDEKQSDENDRLDFGVLDLDSAKTSNLASSLNPDEILWTLYSIPTDLIGFYENFARGVRRGFNDIVSKVSSGGSRLYQDISNIVPSSGYNQKISQDKISSGYDSGEIKNSKTKNTKDDPNSPYSINYSGELQRKPDSPSQPNSGYSLKLEDKDGKKTGHYKYSSPQHSVSLSWPRDDKGR